MKVLVHDVERLLNASMTQNLIEQSYSVPLVLQKGLDGQQSSPCLVFSCTISQVWCLPCWQTLTAVLNFVPFAILHWTSSMLHPAL